MFVAFAKRMAADRIMEQKNAIVGGLWANSNYDDDQNTRQKRLKEIDDWAEESIAAVYGSERDDEYKTEIDEDNPFWAAARRQMIDFKQGELPVG